MAFSAKKRNFIAFIANDLTAQQVKFSGDYTNDFSAVDIPSSHRRYHKTRKIEKVSKKLLTQPPTGRGDAIENKY